MSVRSPPSIEPTRAWPIVPEWRQAPPIEPEWEAARGFGRVVSAEMGTIQTVW